MQMGSMLARSVCLKHLKTGGGTLISELEMPKASAFSVRGHIPSYTHPIWPAGHMCMATLQTILMPHDMADSLVIPPIYKPLDPPLASTNGISYMRAEIMGG